MVDSESVAERREVAAGVTDLLVVDEACGEREQPQRHSGADALQGPSAVGFEGELSLAGPEPRFDPLAHRSERPVASRFVLSVGSQEVRSEACHLGFEVFAREALVGNDGIALELDAGEHLARHLALADVAGGKFEGDRHPVWRAEQVEAKAPEVAAVRAAVAIAGMPGELRAPGGLTRLAARHRRRVKQPQPVAEGRRVNGEVSDDLADRRSERT